MSDSLRRAVLGVVVCTGVALVFAPSFDRDRGATQEGNDEGGRGAWEIARLRDPVTREIPLDMRRRELAYALSLPRRSDILARAAGVGDIVWESRGPVNVGGRTRALGVDVTGEDTIVAGGVSGGLWRSSDRGASWVRTTLPHQLPAVSCLVQDPRRGKQHIWYAGSGEIIGGSASAPGAYYLGDGVLKSIDNGRSWTQLSATLSNTPHSYDKTTDFIWSIAVDPSSADTDKVYIATAGAILRSTDGGASWRTVLPSSPQALFCDVKITSTGVCYATFSWTGFGGAAAGRRGVYRSTDGVRFTQIGPPNLPDSTRRIVVAVAPSNERVVYVLAETPHAGKGGRNFRGDSVWGSLWKYTFDSGNGSGSGGRWEDRSAYVPSFGGSFGDFNPQFSYDLHIAVHPSDENLVLLGGTNLYRSSNGFSSNSASAWIGGYRNIPIDNQVIIPLSYPNHHPDQHLAVFSPTDPSVLYTASDGGLHRTTDLHADTVVWESLNNGYVTSQFYTIAYGRDRAGRPLLLGGMQDNGTWSTSGDDPLAHWVERGTGDGSFCAIVDSGRMFYVSKQEGKTYRVELDDQGVMTGFARIDPAITGSPYRFINPFIVDPQNPHALFCLVGPVIGWNRDVMEIALGNTDSTLTNWVMLTRTRGGTDLSALAMSVDSPSNRLWYGNDSGRVYRMDNVTTEDAVPIDVTGASFPPGAYVNCIAVDPTNGDRAVVVFSNYNVLSLFLTTDAGRSWTPIAGNLEQSPNGTGNGPSCRWFAFAPQPGGTHFLVGTSTGLYSTDRLDGMSTVWMQEGGETVGNVPVGMIAIAPDGYAAAIATHGRGVFTTILPTLGVNHPAPQREASTVLERPTPNPVRSRAMIRWRVAHPVADMRIALYDLLGRRRRLVEIGRAAAGAGSAVIDVLNGGDPLTEGLYYVRLEGDVHSEARELRVIR